MRGRGPGAGQGPNREAIAELYSHFSRYLLDYDRKRMDGFFGPAPGAS